MVVESYSEIHKEWIMVDSQNNAYAEAEGIPLNALEVGITLENAPESVSFQGIGRFFRKKYTTRIQPYLYYFHIDIEIVYPQNNP